jgi:hypothetical protein
MNGYVDVRTTVVKQVQAERRAEAAAARRADDWRRGQAARERTVERARWLRRLAAPPAWLTPAARP